MTRLTRSCLQLLSIVFVLLSAGCAARQENLAQLAPDTMFVRAEEAYAERNWDLASRLLEFFVSEHIGHPSAPDARMLLGDLSFTRREFPTAATHYQRLVLDFPSHPRALEARFKICDSYYQLSPRPALDQEYTRSALQHCESVADNFPTTPEAGQAGARITEMRNKLAQKAYENGVFYFRRGAYDAAAVYFRQVLADYPTTPAAPAALRRLVEAFERIGYVEDAAEAKERLRQEYPESAEAQELPS